MKLHKPIDVGCKSINTILHDRESLVHLLTKTTKFESDEPFKSRKALINGSSFFRRFFLGHLPYLAALSPDESQDLKPNHLITLFARANTLGGIVRPICLAVLRLITNPNFVGCSTGRSAGLDRS
jgi:hypothetical protein